MVASLEPARKLETLSLQAADAEVGRLREFYFEHPGWIVRYFVAGAGGWLGGKRVVILPVALGAVSDTDRAIHVQLTRAQLANAPAIGGGGPPSRQQELDYYRYFGWPPYWHIGSAPAFTSADGSALLLSTEVQSYTLQMDDGELGRVRDFIIDVQYWVVRYLEVDTRAWLPGKHVLISPAWLGRIDGAAKSIRVELARQAIESAPAYQPDQVITRDYEVQLFGHYGRGAYWQRRGDEDPG